jgi:hypothetical protein
VNRIDHTSHAHPATPAARKACRKAFRQDQAEIKAEWEAEQDRKDATWYGSPAPLPQPITIHFVLKDGKTCRVLFDQYQNPTLFVQAHEKGWTRERTVNQAVSEAIHGVFEAYGIGTVETYRVVS